MKTLPSARFALERWRARSLKWAFAPGTLASCVADDPPAFDVDPAPIAVTDAAQWSATPRAEDPLASHRPKAEDCSALAWREELGGIEIDTGTCAYVSLTQASPIDFGTGDTLEVAAWWQNLASVEPATGHLAVLAGDDVLWEEHIEIPSSADVREHAFVSEWDVPAGTPITLHLHNHGANTWHFHHLLLHLESH